MQQYVDLYWKKNRTWPWPEDSFGLTPMYGEDGWCHACGIPKQEQTGSLILQSKNQTATGAWVPYWQSDAICMEGTLAQDLQGRFGVTGRDIRWQGKDAGPSAQLIIPVGPESWFDPQELEVNAVRRYGSAGNVCPDCGVWRWMPLNGDLLPQLKWTPGSQSPPVVASPEWFGDGLKAFRQLLFRRDVAEAIADASPKDFKVDEIDSWGSANS